MRKLAADPVSLFLACLALHLAPIGFARAFDHRAASIAVADDEGGDVARRRRHSARDERAALRPPVRLLPAPAPAPPLRNEGPYIDRLLQPAPPTRFEGLPDPIGGMSAERDEPRAAPDAAGAETGGGLAAATAPALEILASAGRCDRVTLARAVAATLEPPLADCFARSRDHRALPLRVTVDGDGRVVAASLDERARDGAPARDARLVACARARLARKRLPDLGCGRLELVYPFAARSCAASRNGVDDGRMMPGG